MSKYNKEAYSYSQVYMRKRNEKTAIIDTAMEYCIRDNGNLFNNVDAF